MSTTPTSGAGGPRTAAAPFDVQGIRERVPILHREVHGKPLVYLDNAATAQKPQSVIDAVQRYYRHTNANVHRGLHALSEEATTAYEGAREKIQGLINAPALEEIVYVRGTTEAMNLVAQSYGRSTLKPGDEVLITHMEHHSGIVPWQLACEQTGATLRVVPINDRGELILEEFEKLLTDRTKIVSCVHVSNALGTINPVEHIVAKAKEAGAVTVIDGAQAVPHMPVDVQKIGCDFYAFSAHKMYGPTGIGALWGRTELLEAMPPYQGGGEMIDRVTFEKTTYNELPYKFEAGTPNIAGGIGFGAAVDFMQELDLEGVMAHERDLLDYGTEALKQVENLRLIGTAEHKAGVLSFVLDDIHPHDLGTLIDRYGVAIRTGHHCAQPVMDRFGVPATARASFGLYNTREEVDALVEGLAKVRKIFG
jgi:cysteine desulfurase/selenocysteine lyase